MDKTKNSYSPYHPVTVGTLEQVIDNLTYKSITITSFYISSLVWYYGNALDEHTVAGGILEKGQIPKKATLAWSLNKDPQNQTIDHASVKPVTSREYTVSTNSQTTFTLRVYDEKDAEDSDTVSVLIYPGVYYGNAKIPAVYNGTFIEQLTKVLSDRHLNNISVTANKDEYIFYCFPSSSDTPTYTFPEPIFKVEGFEGGFEYVKTISYTNNYGWTSNYDIYKSNRPSLGYVDVKILG